MARIVGVDIPRNKKVPYSLRYIHGIGLTTAKKLCEKLLEKEGILVNQINKEKITPLFAAIVTLLPIVK